MAGVVRKSDATRVLPVLGMLVEVGVDGGPYQELRGASLVDHTAGSRSVSQVATFRGPGAVVGAKTVENVTFDLAAVNPDLPIMDDLDRADRQQLICRVRMSIFSRAILAPEVDGVVEIEARVAAASGIANLQNAWGSRLLLPQKWRDLVDSNEIQMSDLVQIKLGGPPSDDGDTYIVNVIAVDEDTNLITGSGDSEEAGVYVRKFDKSHLAAAVGKAPTNQFAARTGGWRQQFSGTVNQFGSIQGDAAGSPSLSSGVVFTPPAYLSKPKTLRLDEAAQTLADAA